MIQLADKKFHFIGIGGIGMCGLAQLLRQMGATVSGSDLNENKNTKRLQAAGVQIFLGHAAENVGDVDVVVYSSAVPVHNPEMVAARSKKIPTIPRAEALAELMRARRGIAVAGTHGKTTTTAMLGTLLHGVDRKPTVVCGGVIEDWGQSTTQMGSGDWFVAEADESDGSFTKLSPEFAILTNIDFDHMEFFGTESKLMDAFFQFVQRIPFYGALIACGDDLRVRQLLSPFSKRVIFYGTGHDCDWRLEQNSVYHLQKKVGELKLAIPGRHNALNALATLALAQEIGIDVEKALTSLEKFKGVVRRFQMKGSIGNLQIFDDYAHHPTEIRATLQAFREKFPEEELIVVFQPHRYTRTRDCWSEFLDCFTGASQVWITDIYPAGEAPIAGIEGQILAEQIRGVPASHLKRTEVVDRMRAEYLDAKGAGNKKVLVTFGAGDCWKWGEELLSLASEVGR